MAERQEEKFLLKIIGYSGYSGYSGWGGFARVGSLALAYLRGTDGGSFAIYRLLYYIYNVLYFWGGASITCLRHVPTGGWNLAPDLE